MTDTSHTSREIAGQVLILAPLGRDAEGTASVLNKKGLPSLAFRSMNALCETVSEDSGVLIITEEAFTRESLPQLLKVLEAQPLWSDLPIIVLTRPATIYKGNGQISIARLADELGNVTFLERPLHTVTLVSAVRAGLKARKRQFQSRDDAKRLAESNRELEQFAFVASHDLQAPLRKIRFFSDLLKKQIPEDIGGEVLDTANRIQNSAGRMEELVSDLLQLSRVTRQAKPFAPVNVLNVLQTVSDDLLTYRQEVSGTIEIKGKPDLTLLGDESQLQQVFQNLIQNALKFHRKDVPPVVRVIIEKVDNYGRITVADNGIGFNQKCSERIFDIFHRLHSQNDYPGTGIGLSIVKKIVERHQGRIQVESQPGEGCRFMIDLPLANAPILTEPLSVSV